jgi:hypothetical protein
MKAKTTILQEATEIVTGIRQQDYRHARESFAKIATIATVLTGKDLSPQDCCKVLMAVKLTRESFQHKRDNLVDLCGYAHLLQELEQ